MAEDVISFIGDCRMVAAQLESVADSVGHCVDVIAKEFTQNVNDRRLRRVW